MSHISTGYDFMKTKRVIVAGLCRDIEPYIEFAINNIEKTGSLFKGYRALIIENDSKDYTKELLKQWSNPNVKLLFPTVPYVRTANEYSRFHLMAFLRNIYLDEIKNPKYIDYEYVIVIDMDFQKQISTDGIADTFGRIRNFDAVGAFGIEKFNLYWDTMAYRDIRITDTLHLNKYHRILTCLKLIGRTIPQKVRSCFGGLMIYKRSALLESRYHAYDCEHVGLHYEMLDHGHDRIYVNPNMKIQYNTYHSFVVELIIASVSLILIATFGYKYNYIWTTFFIFIISLIMLAHRYRQPDIRTVFNRIIHRSKPLNREAFLAPVLINRASLFTLSKNAKDIHHYGNNLTFETIHKAREGDIIFLTTYELSRFIKRYLPKLKCRIKLLIGNTDEHFSYDLFHKGRLSDIKSFLNHEYIGHVFAENCIYKHPKLTSIPIGVDYHTLYYRNRKQSPHDQEQVLLDIINNSPPLPQRAQRIILEEYNFSKKLNESPFRDSYWASDMELCIAGLGGKPFVDKLDSKYPRAEFWSRLTQNSFIAAPCGNGPDTHRIWEALCLGTIPIISLELLADSALLELYKTLPILIVDRWDLITNSMLDEYRNRVIQETPYAIEESRKRLTMNYWKTLIFDMG